MTMLISGLAVMGFGIAMTYCGALYYALAVQSAEIDAGGKHEALIGLGYTLGPACGLLGLALAGDDPEHFRLWVIGITSLVVLGAGVLAVRSARA
jgi:MFS family permease